MILIFHYSLFLLGHKQTLESQKIRSLVDKIGLFYTVCKLFKNYRMQNMFRIWSSILIHVNNRRSVGRWVGGSVVGGSVVGGFNKTHILCFSLLKV